MGRIELPLHAPHACVLPLYDTPILVRYRHTTNPQQYLTRLFKVIQNSDLGRSNLLLPLCERFKTLRTNQRSMLGMKKIRPLQIGLPLPGHRWVILASQLLARSCFDIAFFTSCTLSHDKK